MVHSLDPFAPLHFALFGGTLGVAYMLGSLLKFRSEHALLSIGIRLCLGAMFMVCLVAGVVTMGNTLLLPLLLFLLASIDLKATDRWADIRSLSWPLWVGMLVLAALIFSVEALRCDVRLADGLRTGFADISYYSSLGNAMFVSGTEGAANNLGTAFQSNPLFYHMGDLWFSGIYSHFFGVMPQYAYVLLARSVSLFALVLLFGAWLQVRSGSWVLALVVAPLVLFAVETVIYYIYHPSISLLQTFVFNWGLYGSGPYLNVAMCALPLLVLATEGAGLWALGGLMLVPVLNPGIMLSFPAGVGLILIIKAKCQWLFPRWAHRVPFTLKDLGILFVLAAVPILFATVTGRRQGESPNMADPAYIYLIGHTMVRALLSATYILPLLVGACYIAIKKETAQITWLALAGFLGTLLAFSIAFPWIQGNTIQMPALYEQALLFPIGLLGLSVLLMEGTGWKRGVAAVALLAVVVCSGRILIGTQAYATIYTDAHGSGGQTKLTTVEHAGLCALAANGERKVGYWVNSMSNYPASRPHYTEFTGIKGLVNGLEYYRLNELPCDVTASKEMRQAYEHSALYHYNANHPNQPERALEAFVDDLNPDVLLTKVGTDVYQVPDALAHRYPVADTLGGFIIHHKATN